MYQMEMIFRSYPMAVSRFTFHLSSSEVYLQQGELILFATGYHFTGPLHLTDSLEYFDIKTHVTKVLIVFWSKPSFQIQTLFVSLFVCLSACISTYSADHHIILETINH